MSGNGANVSVQLGKTRLIIQVGILGLLTFLTSYITLYLDRRNDGRYVSKEDYQRDRANDEKLRAGAQLMITYRMDQTDRKLEDISRDIKALLSRPVYPPGNQP